MLAEGTNITIYAGSGCVDAHDEVVELAERLKAPVAHTSRGKDVIEYDNPNNVGMTGVIGTESGYHAILNCDTLLLLGTDFAWRQFYPDHAKIIQVDIDSTHDKPSPSVDLGVVGNIKDTLQALLPRVAQREDATFLGHLCGTAPEGAQSAGREGHAGPSRQNSRPIFDVDHQSTRQSRCCVYSR